MRVAVQGCSHGCLSAIYDSVALYESINLKKVDLLLLCGDFQALRNRHDFASLAVPPKYHALGTFHEYYSGKRKAPLLTLVIGGNHEASNYMWELYHGGWLAENIYYLGAAGSVLVNGLRISGASGIFKDHDYTKGHHEKVPYNNSTLRSIYHIRSYDVDKLLQLPRRKHSIFLSHDWPTTIPNHGNTRALISRKPFFKSEVETNTLGSPPLLQIMRQLQPEHWFSAHLHVKFAAVYDHSSNGVTPIKPLPIPTQSIPPIQSSEKAEGLKAGNPDEIQIEDEDDLDAPAIGTSEHTGAAPVPSISNPDEIAIDDDEDFDDDGANNAAPFTGASDPEQLKGEEAIQALKVDESADLVEAARKNGNNPPAADGIIGAEHSLNTDQHTSISTSEDKHSSIRSDSEENVTKFLALDKCGPGKDFIQFLDIPTPSSTSSTSEQQPIQLTYDPHWLAITRVMHQYLSLTQYEMPLPPTEELSASIASELQKIKDEGLLVPEKEWDGSGMPNLIWEKGDIEISRVQRFWPTAPAEGEPGGSPSAWYTNPQTEAFCGMLGIPNKINPAPTPPSAEIPPSTN